ncbi:hypothetical protein L6164_000439 [Bauhinia variegata]|nr:hypothetical protein L6164_000439 [Bauhinia variegata]
MSAIFKHEGGGYCSSSMPSEDVDNLHKMQNLHSQRIRSLRQGLNSAGNALQLQPALRTSALINNVGGTTKGNYNGSMNIYNNKYKYYYNKRDEEEEL